MKTIFEMEFGSHLYGTNIETSDRDYKGIFLPPARRIILGVGAETITRSSKPDDRLKNTHEDTDIELFSLKQYMKLLLQGQTVALSMLFCPPKNCRFSTPISRDIVSYKDKWLHSGVTAFAGYCRQQANKYGIKGSRVAAARTAMDFFASYSPSTKLHEIWDKIVIMARDTEHMAIIKEAMKGRPELEVRMLEVCNRKVQEHITCKEAHSIFKHVFDEYGKRALQAETNENVDWKACMHAVRVAGEACELLLDHHITYPRPDAPLLKQIRLGELPYQQVADLIESGLVDLQEAQAKSTLPSQPDYEFAEDFIHDTYETIVVNQCYWSKDK